MSERTCSLCLLLFSYSVMLVGCDQPFNPKAPFDQHLVVFCILSTAQDTQYVRVSTTYDVSGSDPAEHHTDDAVADASVRVTGTSNAHSFTQVYLPRSDTTRYKTPILAYMGFPFRPDNGAKYDLSVTSSLFGNASANVTVPDPASLGFGEGSSQLDSPDDAGQNKSISLLALLSPLCKGYLAQMFVDYQVRADSGWKDERIEVPTALITDTLSLWVVTYPSLTRRVVRQIGTGFSVKAYVSALIRVLMQHPQKGIIFRRVVARVLQCEQGLYDYYNTVNGFRDPLSIRLDLPEYSNVSGAKGLFGAYALDSLTHILPDNFSFNIK